MFRRSVWIRFVVCQIVLFGLLTNWQPGGRLLAQQPAPENFRIVIVDGDRFINNIRKHTARDPVVEIRDRNDSPVPGAAVAFLLPSTGPGASFANGSKLLTVVTDENGRAVAAGLQPNHVPGRFRINISASSQGQAATPVAITQTNVLGGFLGLGIGATTVVVVGGVATAAAVTAATVVGGGGPKKASISIGPPHF